MIPYTYTVIESNPQGAVFLFKSPGYPDVTVGTHAPRRGEDPNAIARMYAPIDTWLERDVVRVAIPVGTAGSFTPPAAPVDKRTPLQRAKDEKLAEIAAWRYGQEVGGISLGGARIRTDRESQATITSAFISLSQGLSAGIDFKAEGGQWITLGLEQITPIAQAVVAHVQACFTTERDLSDLVNACTTVAEVDAVLIPMEVVS